MTEVTAGDLLVAPPEIADARFDESVVLVLSNDLDTGSLGFVINCDQQLEIRDLDLGKHYANCDDIPVYWGGPVNIKTIWMLHSPEWATEETVEVNDEWSMTSSMEMFSLLNQGHWPEHFRLMSGYCTWAPAQLEEEIAGDVLGGAGWLTVEQPSRDWVMEQSVEALWSNSAKLSAEQAVSQWI